MDCHELWKHESWGSVKVVKIGEWVASITIQTVEWKNFIPIKEQTVEFPFGVAFKFSSPLAESKEKCPARFQKC